MCIRDSCRELFAPFTDDVPDLGELLVAQSQINLNKFNPNGDLVSAMADVYKRQMLMRLMILLVMVTNLLMVVIILME